MTAGDVIEPQGPALLRPSGALGRFRASRVGLTAAASAAFVQGVARPVDVRRTSGLASGLRAPHTVAAPAAERAVRAPRWWAPSAEAEAPAEASRPGRAAPPAPARGLDRAASRIDRESWTPGRLGAGATPTTVPMRLPAEVAAAGSMLTSLDSRRRTASPTRGPAPRSAGSGTTVDAAGSRRAAGPDAPHAQAPSGPVPSRPGAAPSLPAVRRRTAPPRLARRRAAAAKTGAAAAALTTSAAALRGDAAAAHDRPTLPAGRNPGAADVGSPAAPATAVRHPGGADARGHAVRVAPDAVVAPRQPVRRASELHPGTAPSRLPRAASARVLLGHAAEAAAVSLAGPGRSPLRRSSRPTSTVAAPGTALLAPRPSGLVRVVGEPAGRRPGGHGAISPVPPGPRASDGPASHDVAGHVDAGRGTAGSTGNAARHATTSASPRVGAPGAPLGAGAGRVAPSPSLTSGATLTSGSSPARSAAGSGLASSATVPGSPTAPSRLRLALVPDGPPSRVRRSTITPTRSRAALGGPVVGAPHATTGTSPAGSATSSGPHARASRDHASPGLVPAEQVLSDETLGDHALTGALRPVPGALARAAHVAGAGVDAARPGRVTAVRRRLASDRAAAAHAAADHAPGAGYATAVSAASTQPRSTQTRSMQTRSSQPPSTQPRSTRGSGTGPTAGAAATSRGAGPVRLHHDASLTAGLSPVRRATGTTTRLDVGAHDGVHTRGPGTPDGPRATAATRPASAARTRRASGTVTGSVLTSTVPGATGPRTAPPSLLGARGTAGPAVPSSASAWRGSLTEASAVPLRRSVLPPRAPVRVAPPVPASAGTASGTAGTASGTAGPAGGDTSVGLAILRRALRGDAAPLAADAARDAGTTSEELRMSAPPPSAADASRGLDHLLDDRLLARLADALEDDLTDRVARRVERRLLEETALRTTGLTPGAF